MRHLLLLPLLTTLAACGASVADEPRSPRAQQELDRYLAGKVAGTPQSCLPTYRRPTLLSQTLQSCFAQDYRPLEIDVADTGPLLSANSGAGEPIRRRAGSRCLPGPLGGGGAPYGCCGGGMPYGCVGRGGCRGVSMVVSSFLGWAART